MEKNIKTYHCGIIYGCESSSGSGKVILDEQGITVDGGIFHDVRYRAGYREIERVYYSTVLPKMRFELLPFCIGEDKGIPVALSLRHGQLAGILRLLRKHGVKFRRMSFLPHIGRWWSYWYGQ